MLDIKAWIKSAGFTKVANTAFVTKTTLPYVVFVEESNTENSSDLSNDIIERNITIEYYSSTISAVDEKKIENLLKEIHYTKSRMWVDAENCFQTLYDFSILERNVI